MSEQPSDTMNLDLNLGPVPAQESGLSSPRHSTNLDEWIEEPFERLREDEPFGRLREAVRLRWRHVQIPNESQNLSVELNQLLGNADNEDALQTGEGSVSAEERVNDVSKGCENNNGFSEEGASEKKDVDEKGTGNDGSFFDCNICLDLSREPVVTCCGHLFCWPCLYTWLNVHSEAKECPVCKGEVTTKNVTPIYGRGSNPRQVDDYDPTIKVPTRPTARRVESWRQTIQRNGYTFPMEEMLRRISSRFEFARDLVPHEPHRHTDNGRGISERTNNLLNSILTSRRILREQLPVQPPEGIVDLTQGETSADTAEHRRVQPSLLRRARSNRTSEFERLSESTSRMIPVGRNQEQSGPVDDRDSFSSIAAVINSEGQTIDTAVEIDSTVSLSTSSSRLRNEASRASDIDSGDSRAPRRRRLN